MSRVTVVAESAKQLWFHLVRLATRLVKYKLWLIKIGSPWTVLYRSSRRQLVTKANRIMRLNCYNSYWGRLLRGKSRGPQSSMWRMYCLADSAIGVHNWNLCIITRWGSHNCDSTPSAPTTVINLNFINSELILVNQEQTILFNSLPFVALKHI